MTSQIDVTKPVTGSPTTQSVRDNFTTAASEITDLQNGVIPGLSASSGSSLVGFIQSGTGAVARTVQSKEREIVSVTDFGAALNGTTDDAAAATLALNSGAARVIVPGSTTTVMSLASGISVPAGVELIMDEGVKIKPSTNMTYVVKVHAGGFFKGQIDTSAITFTGIAVNFDGDDQGDAVPFNLSTRSGCDVRLKGGTGSGTGTALKLHADNNANARVMGIKAVARIYGFEYGGYLRQTSADLSKFVNANDIWLFCDQTLNALYMQSSHASGYGVDGNRIYLQHQPMSGTTVPSATICGQTNEWNIYPYDWSTVAGTAPYAISIASGTRESVLTYWSDTTYLQNNSTDASILILNPFNSGAFYLRTLKGISSDGVIKLGASTIELPNNTFFKGLLSGGSSRNIIGFDTSDDLNILGSNGAGDNIILDVSNSTGIYAFRLNSSNAAFLGPNTGYQMQSKRLQAAQGATKASANNLVLGTDGNRFQISGSTQINLIDNSSWQGGAIVTLHFQSTPTVKHNQAASGNNKPIMLSGSVDFVAAANGRLVLQYDSTDGVWYEIGRTVA